MKRLLLTEDLTPHKLALLFLVELYCTGAVPMEERSFTLTLVAQMVSGSEDTIYDRATGELVVVPTFHDLCSRLPTQTRHKLILSLWKINSVESLDSRVRGMHELLAPATQIYAATGKVLPRSLLGAFIARVTTSLTLVSFDEVFLLMRLFQEYRGRRKGEEEEENNKREEQNGMGIENKSVEKEAENPQRISKVKDSHVLEFPSLDSNDDTLFSTLSNQLDTLIGNDFGRGEVVPVARQDLEVLLDHQITVLELCGTPTPASLRRILEAMTSHTSLLLVQSTLSNMPQYYYIRYLEHLHSSNYNGAFELLHQYFDYMVSNNSKYFYHFALVSKASLHQFFGEDQSAIDLIEEAISVARENKDNLTLTYILSWLFNFVRNKPDLRLLSVFNTASSEHQLLDFLVQKARQVSLSLYAMSFNFKAIQLMHSGDGTATFFDALLKATYVALHDSTLQLFVKAAETQSAVWHTVGVPALSTVYHELAMEFSDKPIDRLLLVLKHEFLTRLRCDAKGLRESLERLHDEHRELVARNNSVLNAFQVRMAIVGVREHMDGGRSTVAGQMIAVLEHSVIQELELRNEVVLLRVENAMLVRNHAAALALIESHSKHGPAVFVMRLAVLRCEVYWQTGNYHKGLVRLVKLVERARQLMLKLVVDDAVLVFARITRSLSAGGSERLREEVAQFLEEYMAQVDGAVREVFQREKEMIKG